jgi:hypothetical protein
MAAILMTEEYWASSQFSVTRYYGRIKINELEYYIVNKEGKDVFECSIEAEKEGREKAIEPGEPADLVRKDFIPFYRKLKRDKFIEVLNANQHTDDGILKKIYKELCDKNKSA